MSISSHKSSFILLHTTKYGDSSIILHGYSKTEGRQSYILKGVGRKKGVNILHPLSILDLELTSYKGGMQTIKEINPIYRLDSIRTQILKGNISLFISELLYKLLIHKEDGRDTYSFLENSIIKLEQIDGKVSNFHLWFIISLSATLGIMPTCLSQLESHPFSDEESLILEKILKTNFDQIMLLPLNGTLRNKFLNSSIKYIEQNLGISLNIKSLKILHLTYS